LFPSGFRLQKVLKIHIFYGVRMSASCPTPNLEDQGILFCLVITLTCLAWNALPVAMLLSAYFSGSFDQCKPHHYVKVGIPSVGGGGILKYKILGCVIKLEKKV
jgi:hypothetical protein